MAGQLALSLNATPPGTYRQRGTRSLQRLFRAHFAELVARYEDEFARQLGRFRLERISKAVQRFLACGDYPLSGSGVFSRRESSRGIARIKCTNPQGGSRACAAGARTADWSTFGPSAAAYSTPWSGRCTDLPKVLRDFAAEAALCEAAWGERGAVMGEELIDQVEELLRETFEGARPGEGTQYLDHDSGIIPTVRKLSAEEASQRREGRPSIASHLRHMEFHLRVSHEWIAGDHSRRDWKGSFLTQQVTPSEWQALVEQIQQTRQDLLRILRGLPADRLVAEGAGMGAIAHLAYHLGAIRQLLRPP